LTNKLVTTSEKLAADHIFPAVEIEQLPGFDLLTKEQQLQVLNNPRNFQGLPQSFNASKGASLNWTTYKGEPLNPDYVANLQRLQQEMRQMLQQQINNFLR
jgi:filamentous hemagglutinin